MKCPVEDCDAEYSSEKLLEQHMEISHPEYKPKEETKMGILGKKETSEEVIEVPVVESKKPEPKPVKENTEEWDNVLIYVKIRKKTGKLGRILQQADLDDDVKIVKTAMVPEEDRRINELIDYESGLEVEQKKFY